MTSSARPARPPYLGFYFWWWAGVTALLVIGSFSLFAAKPAVGLLGLVLAGLSGLYARYLYRGGTWRMIFFIF